MSGVEAFAVIGAITSVISLVQTIQQVYQAANTASGLGEEFQRVADRMSLVLTTLEELKRHQEGQQAIYSRTTDPTTKSTMEQKAAAVKQIMESCERSLGDIKTQLDNAIPAADASRARRFATALRTQVAPGRVKKVQASMADVLTVLALLHDSFDNDAPGGQGRSNNRAQELEAAAQEVARPVAGGGESCAPSNSFVFNNSAAAKIAMQGNNNMGPVNMSL